MISSKCDWTLEHRMFARHRRNDGYALERSAPPIRRNVAALIADIRMIARVVLTIQKGYKS